MTVSTKILQPTLQKDFPYFRRIWKNVVVALLAASFIPLLLIGGGMYYYSAVVLYHKTAESLRSEMTNHKNSIDNFLMERVMDLKILTNNISRDNFIRPGVLERIFQSLQNELPCFQDLGVIDDQGRHLAYVGPYELLSKNYRNTFWFKAVKTKGVYISDVFLGFRNVPHFVVAVKQELDDGFLILRATMDTAFFNDVVYKIVQNTRGDSFLINKDGIFQTTPRKAGRPMGLFNFSDLDVHKGIRQKEQNGLLQITVWLENVSWMCVVQVERKEIFSPLYRVRNIGIFVFILGSILIILTVLLTSNYLIGRLEFKRRSIRVLDHQLHHASIAASTLPLSNSFFLKIKDIFGHIGLASQNLYELSQKDPPHIESRKRLRTEINLIRSQTYKGRRAIDKFLNATRPIEPMVKKVNMNDLIDNLIELFEREFHFNHIRLIRKYDQSKLKIRSDPSRLRQVFQNLIFNAIRSIDCNGKIEIRTESHDTRIYVTIYNDGPKIPEENIEKIFSPHYASKDEGMGLSLSVCRNILKKLGGDIYGKNDPIKGVSFTVDLPVLFRSPG